MFEQETQFTKLAMSAMHPGYKPTLIHPEFFLASLSGEEFPTYLFSGEQKELQEKVIMENLPTLGTMLPDIVRTNAALREAGFYHTTNPLYDKRSDEGLRMKALAYGNVIRNTYPDGVGGTHYPLKIKDPTNIIEDVLAEKLDLYSVIDSDGLMVAVFGTVHRGDILNRFPHAVELGRSGIRSDFMDKMPSARGISKLRLYHLLTDPRFFARQGKLITYIYSDIRLAQKWNENFPGGRGVQGVFFGGRDKGEQLGFGMGTFGWRYRLGRPEPFAFIFRPLLPETYRHELEKQQLLVPDKEDNEMIKVLLEEAFGVLPKIHYNPSQSSVKPTDPNEIKVVHNCDPKSSVASDVFAKIDIIDTDQETKEMLMGHTTFYSLQDALSLARKARAPFIEVYVEASLGNGTNAERISQTVATLKSLGFVANGWLPSNRKNSASMMLSFGKLGADADNPVMPDMPNEYYADGFEGTKIVGEKIFNGLLQKAIENR